VVGVYVCVWALCVLSVGHCGAGVGSECAAGGFVVGVCVWALCVLSVGQCGAGWGSEFAAGGLVVCVCVCVCWL